MAKAEDLSYFDFVLKTAVESQHDLEIIVDINNFMRETLDKYWNDTDRQAKVKKLATTYMEEKLKDPHDKEIACKAVLLLMLHVMWEQWKEVGVTLH
jgi:hypothetical protein